MVNMVHLHVGGRPLAAVYDNRDVVFTLAGLKKFLNEVNPREGYQEGQPGDEVRIPASLLYWYVEGSTLEVVSK